MWLQFEIGRHACGCGWVIMDVDDLFKRCILDHRTAEMEAYAPVDAYKIVGRQIAWQPINDGHPRSRPQLLSDRMHEAVDLRRAKAIQRNCLDGKGPRFLDQP